MTIKIEIAYADEQSQVIIPVSLPDTCTIQTAIQRSGILNQSINIDLTKNKVGIFGKVYPLGTLVQNGDRVEIYRVLVTDPKKNRSNRAKKRSYR